MKLRLLLCFLAGVAAGLAIIFWPSDATSQREAMDVAAYEAELESVIAASERGEALRALMDETPEAEREAMAHLLINMPDFDREGMDLALLKENVEYATLARQKYSWAKALPNDVYLNDVLPYYVVDEVRDPWRKELHELFAPAVDTCTTMYEAICAVNANIPRLTGVDYNTKREKTNQSPRESMRQGLSTLTAPWASPRASLAQPRGTTTAATTAGRRYGSMVHGA